MLKTINISLTSSIDPFLRIVCVLRKKGFSIENVSFSSLDNSKGKLVITIKENSNLGINEAIAHVKKVVGVYDIQEIN